jgi:uncharacterized protein
MGEANRPILPGERILALDVIRGFAMFGVLLAYCLWSLGTLPAEAYSPVDRTLETVLSFAVDNKFYTLLAFLFGLGFQLQLGRAGIEDGEIVRLYRRRLLVLAGIGLAHALLLRNGDILLPYALTGLLLIPFRRAADRTLVAAALLILLAEFALRLLWEPSGLPVPQRPEAAGRPYLVENFLWVRYWYLSPQFTWPLNLTLFLFGFLAGRNNWLTQLAAAPRRLLTLLAVGLAAGAVLFPASTMLAAALNRAGQAELIPFATLLFTLHAWGMASAYAALILFALRGATGRAALAPLAAVGRMALTNYLMQAAVIVPLCLAFEWFDRFTPSRALLLVAIYFPLQAAFSLLWLRRFDFGPAEWFWRLLTYGRVPRSRRAAEAEATL